MQEMRARPGSGNNPASGSVEIVLPGALVSLFPDAPTHVELNASTVTDMLDALDSRWPGMRDRLCDSRPDIRKHINIFIDGHSAKLDTPLKPGQKVFILTAVSGG